MTNKAIAGPARRSRLRGAAGVTALLLAPLAACDVDQILEVEDIDVALPSAIVDSAALPALLAGSIGNFGVAYNGGFDVSHVTLSGSLSDEFINTETFPTRIEIDQRVQQFDRNGSLSGQFYRAQQARALADRASKGYAQFAPRAVGHAEVLNLSALSYVLFAEIYCGAVPISEQLPDGTFRYGTALSTDELLAVAIQKADSALAITADTAPGTGSAGAKTQQARVARIVKARALLNLNRPALAAAAINGETGVPTTFQYINNHSETTGRQNNGTWALTVSVGRFGVAEREGTNGLPFRTEGDEAGTVKDPRVVNRRRGGSGRGFDNSTPQWMQQKYPLRTSPIVIADGVEARLIEAEAALRTGDAAGALVILNALRANAGLLALRGFGATSLPPLVLQTTPAAQENQLFKERAYWLYLTAHRLGDLRRLIRQYGRGSETVFPTGTYHKPGTYGTDVNTPIPQEEDNNPDFERSACMLTKA